MHGADQLQVTEGKIKRVERPGVQAAAAGIFEIDTCPSEVAHGGVSSTLGDNGCPGGQSERRGEAVDGIHFKFHPT